MCQHYFNHLSSSSISLSHYRGGVSLHVAQEGARASARLSLTSVTPQDAGNYTCNPESLEPAHVTVFVLQGKKVVTLSDCHPRVTVYPSNNLRDVSIQI